MSDYQAHVDGFMMLLRDLPNDENVHTHDSMMEQLRNVESAFKRAMELRREEMEADLLVDVALDASLVAQEAAIAAKSAVKKIFSKMYGMDTFGQMQAERRQEPECEPPTCEDWKKWGELEDLDRVLGNKSYEAFLNHRSLKESNASEEEIAKAKEAEWIARGKSMRAYDNLVNWMEKFGFRSFDHVDEVKESLNQV